MADIYSAAQKVLIWLGPEDEDSRVAMEHFARMVNDLANPRLDSDNPTERSKQHDNLVMRAMNNLLRREWLTRVWTLQEVAAAEEATILCGAQTLDWALLQRFNDVCQTDNEGRWTTTLRSITSATDRKTGDMGRFATGNVQAISRLRASSRNMAPGISNLQHLHRVRSCGATRPRDKVLSLLHFLSEDLRSCLLSLNNGVGLSTEDIYHAVANFELVGCRHMDFLGAAGLVQISHEHRLMPTWVPDWTVPELTHDLWLLNSLSLEQTNRHLYQASKAEQAYAIVSEDGRLLHTEARLIDVVGTIGPPAPFSILNDHAVLGPNDLAGRFERGIMLNRERYEHLQQCLTLAAACRSRYGNSFTAACHQTLMRGIIQEGSGSTNGGTQRRATDTELNGLFDHYISNTQALDSPDLMTKLNAMRGMPLSGKVIEHVQDSFKGRVFFTTETGYMGLGPSGIDTMRQGDKVCVISGCCTPFVIRPVEGTTCYDLIGEAYVHGLMDGEAMHMYDVKEEILTLR